MNYLLLDCNRCFIVLQEVAVKVQRPDIRRHAYWDLGAYRVLLRLYGEIDFSMRPQQR